ncbi:MAG: hypothetical protein WC565_00210 [Parcubacteria group bacterium]
MEKKVYTWLAVLISAFIGGPFGGIYMLSQNYKTLGKDDLAKKWLLFGSLAIVGFLVVMSLLPASFTSPTAGAAASSAIAIGLGLTAKQKQDKEIKEILAAGGRKQSVGKIIGINVLSILITLVLTLVVTGIFALIGLNK